MKVVNRKLNRNRRHERIRKNVSGTAERPRMSVMISNKNMYVQFIDDENHRTIASASSSGMDGGNNIAKAAKVGKLAAENAKAAGIAKVVVDRGGFKYHGKVKTIVEAVCGTGKAAETKETK
jgi:large subunit ribosomal protein L18